MELFNRNDNVLSKRELDKKHREVIAYLDDRWAFFVTYVLQLGKPEWSSKVPTAAVDATDTIDKNGKFDADNFRFLFNPEFASKLPVKEMAFVEAHETMHVLLNHLRLLENFIDRDAFRDMLKQQKEDARPTKEQIKNNLRLQRDMQIYNIAADCVINDYLVTCGLEPVETIPLMRGEDWIGENAAYMTVTEVYNRIKANQNKDKQSGDGEGDEEGEGSGSGQPGEGNGKLKKADGSEGEYNALDDHNWMLGDDDVDKMADALDKLYDEMEKAGKDEQGINDKRDEEKGEQTKAQKALAQSMRPGTEAGNMSKFIEQGGLTLSWAKLLKEIDPNIFKEPGIAPPQVSSFHQRRRKLNGAQFKKINLPVYRTEERTEKKTNEIRAIVLALDVSGSIGPRDAQRFMTLAKSIPTERIKLFCCTFQTRYQPFDPQNDTNVSIGGGTDFEAIVQFIDERVKPEIKGQYPKSVVVITDGCASIRTWPTEEEAKSWFWLMSPRDYGTGPSSQIGRKANLDDYIN